LLRVLAGLDERSAGEVLVGGTDLTTISEEQIRQHLAYVPAEPGLIEGYVSDAITMGRSTQRDWRDDLETLGLHFDESVRLHDLSRGERVRFALVRAVAIAPQILILDEPTSALGDTETRLVLDWLTTLNMTVIVASHDPLVHAWANTHRAL
jgi:ABC-type cobalamin/Fe3+-siderophores transport system ATPase subunit